MRSFLFLLAACAASFFSYQGWDEVRSLAAIQQALAETSVNTLTTTWTDAENLTHTVSTPRDGTESAAEHAARHAESVAALKALYPPAE